MNNKKSPDAVLQELLSNAATDAARERLYTVNELCRIRFEAGDTDFSIAALSRVCTAKKLTYARALHIKGCEYLRDLIGAWEIAAAPIVPDLNTLSDHHPEVVLRRLLEKGSRSDRAAKLRSVHEICRKLYNKGVLDFSVLAIGAICEEAGLFKRKSLSNNPSFADYRELINSWGDHARPWLTREPEAGKSAKRIQKSNDFNLTWVLRNYPDLEVWQALAVDWLNGQTKGGSHKLAGIINFFEKYLLHPEVPTDPRELLARGTRLPNFREVACPPSTTGIPHNNAVSQFLDYVLLREFGFVSDDGVREVSPAYRNPVPYITGERAGATLSETVRSPLPYGYIDEIRHMLAQGQNFQDWTFAQSSLGVDLGESGAPGGDWFDVTEDMVDRNDPDCVLRTRVRTRNKKATNVLQMWSPVRWVAVLIKLLVPLRTIQVRLLDSGEFDSYEYRNGTWRPNERVGGVSTGGKERRQGAIRRNVELGQESNEDVILYINTNKTADIRKSGPGKGYEIPWHKSPDAVNNVYYWLEKLRNWQSKYNPVSRLTSWSELDGRHIPAKLPAQLASYPDASFLFRLAESKKSERHLPVSDGMVDVAWTNVLAEYEDRLATRGEKHANGLPIRLVDRDDKGRLFTQFPLHSLRVSLITALALEGEVPFSILYKVVGHSRLLMTLYYIKPGAAHTRQVLAEGEEKLRLSKDKSIIDFLTNAEYSVLVDRAVANSESALFAAIPEQPAARNPAGWMLMHHGCCLVGGNTSEIEGNKAIGGCYSGGPNIGSSSTPKYAPVPGGARNCIRCRWFVTETHYLPALVAQFNSIAYNFDEAWRKCFDDEQALQELKRTKARMEADVSGPPFADSEKLKIAQRVWESGIKRYSDFAEDLAACSRLVERVHALLNANNDSNSYQLVVQGSVADVEFAIEENASELLQLSGVCRDLEVYADLEAGKATIRRSQILDSALYNEGLPPMFMTLSEKDQLLCGNALMRKLSLMASPDNAFVGERKIVEIIDAGIRLREALGIDMDECVKSALPATQLVKKVIPIACIG